MLTTSEFNDQSRSLPDSTWWDRSARQALLSRLAHLQQGVLVLRDGIETLTLSSQDAGDPLMAELIIQHPRAYRDFVLGGSIGAAEAYVAGDWTTPDLTNLVRLLARNVDLLNAIDDGAARLGKPFLKSLHWLHRNTVKGSRRNIAAHYDLGNELFQTFLDPTMMYSAAIFPHPEATLEQAQLYRLDRICRKLDLQPSDHLVEIGTGWGGMAIYAAQNYGCRVTTTTISRQQYEYACGKIAELGLQDQIEVLFEDYRNLQGQYDKLVSIEMLEAVGHAYYPSYFRQCGQLLKPEGLALIQVITLPEQRYERARRNVDFIQRYIFPGSCIPSIGTLLGANQQTSDLRLIHLEDIGPHYATTLKAWREAFLAHQDEVLALGFDQAFVRLWEFYFAYCEGSFAERAIGDAQLLFAKPRNRRETLLGMIE